jgi:hypothetical protein
MRTAGCARAALRGVATLASVAGAWSLLAGFVVLRGLLLRLV